MFDNGLSNCWVSCANKMHRMQCMQTRKPCLLCLNINCCQVRCCSLFPNDMRYPNPSGDSHITDLPSATKHKYPCHSYIKRCSLSSISLVCLEFSSQTRSRFSILGYSCGSIRPMVSLSWVFFIKRCRSSILGYPWIFHANLSYHDWVCSCLHFAMVPTYSSRKMKFLLSIEASD